MDEKGYIYELDVISACFILVSWSLPYLLVYKSTFYDQKITLDFYTSRTQRPDPRNPIN